jgi:hypothetical protein
LADEVGRVLKEAGATGMSRSALGNAFGRHKSSAELSKALNLLAAGGLAAVEKSATTGRSVELWRYLFAQ